MRYIFVNKEGFHTQIEVIHSFAMEKAKVNYDTYNEREMEVWT